MPTAQKPRAIHSLRKHLNKHPLAEFAEEVGVSIFAVRKWLSGERVPRDRTKLRISQVTDDQVRIQDWVGTA